MRWSKAGFAWVVDHIVEHWPAWLTTMVAGSGMTYLASATKWLSEYGPIVWGAIGISALLAMAVFFWIASLAIRNSAEARYKTMMSAPPTTVNPLLSHFERQKVNLSDFYSHQRVLHKKTFKNCEIHGPGAICLLNGCTINGLKMVQTDIVLVKNAPIFSGIGFVESAFIDCEYVNLTLYLPEMAVSAIEEDAKRHGRLMPTIVGFNG